MTGERSSAALGDIIKVASFMLGPLTVWLYVAGWSYAYAYFDHFRIPLLMVDLSIEHLFVYGGLVLWKNGLWTLLVLASVSASVWVCFCYADRIGRLGIAGLAVGLALVILILGRLGGISTASDDFQIQRAHDYRAYPRVRLALTKDAPSLDTSAIADLVISDCRPASPSQSRPALFDPARQRCVTGSRYLRNPLDRGRKLAPHLNLPQLPIAFFEGTGPKKSLYISPRREPPDQQGTE